MIDPVKLFEGLAAIACLRDFPLTAEQQVRVEILEDILTDGYGDETLDLMNKVLKTLRRPK